MNGESVGQEKAGQKKVRTAKGVEVERPKFEGGFVIVHEGTDGWVIYEDALDRYSTAEEAQQRADELPYNARVFYLPSEDEPEPMADVSKNVYR